jgi:dTDP-4-amino-4,6-dideoxygalactose transaminase
MNGQFIHFARPDYGDAEIAEVVDTLRSGWTTTGPRTARFEEEFKAYTGAKAALAVNSCTAALHLALAALGIGPGDEVITTPLTFCATVNVIVHVGATPVLVDIGPDFNIDPAAIERAITPRTRAIIPVHIAGLACDMEQIWSIARRHGLFVVEDAAHAAGTRYQNALIGGGQSDAVAFSFYATKNLSTGEGGMVTSSDPALCDRMRVLCLHGIGRDAWKRYSKEGSWFYEVVECGFKYNLSDLQSALGLAQLHRLDAMNSRRREIAQAYDAAFEAMDELQLPPGSGDPGHAWHLYMLRLRTDRLAVDRAGFIEELRRKHVGASVHFIPIPLHPYFRETLELRDPCRRALAEYPRLVSLPLYSSLADHEVERVIRAVKQTVLESSRSLVCAGT